MISQEGYGMEVRAISHYSGSDGICGFQNM